jgi:nucleotide-binding universal stress UspA family protein
MYKQIVVGTDGSAAANLAVDRAIELARLSGATLHVVNAHKKISSYHMAAAAEVGVVPDMVESNEAIQARSEQIANEGVERAKSAGIEAEAHCIAADPAEALVRTAEDVDADLVVVGNLGMSGARRFMLGSVPNKVSHHCPTSLLIVDTSGARA